MVRHAAHGFNSLSVNRSKKEIMAYQSTNPYNGKVLQKFDEINDAALEEKLSQASNCFENEWRGKSFAERAAVLAHKPDLIAYLLESSRITVQLLESAMRRCDQFNDSEKARQDMRKQVLETPPHLRQDLLEHFLGKPPQAPVASLKEQRKNNHD